MALFPSLPAEADLGDVFRRFPDSAGPLMVFFETVLRGEGELSVGERELIAAYVSGLNACTFCYSSHKVYSEIFGQPKGESACECERGTDANLSQGLQLLNSSDLAGKLGNGSGRANQLANAKDQPVEAKIEELYLIAYGRQPTPAETEIVIAYLDEKQHAKQAYEDLIWSLVNSKEFLFTH